MQVIPDKEADKRAAKLLKRYDDLRREFNEVERELTIAATEYGKRRGYYTFTRIETMRLMMENEAKRSNVA